VGAAVRFLSIFSGIEACSVALKPLGWTCVGVAEVDAFPSAVLAHHYPDVPNLGDVSQITDERIAALGPIDLVVGGSPCQDLSVAGKRAGLAGARSGLFSEQVRVFHAARSLCGARFLLWENVPGAFSSNAGRDFAVVVGAMAGCELAVPREGWGTEGVALGRNGLVEWAVLDAQWFGVAQRRRRVFALLDAGAWADRPPVLLEPEGLRGDSAPRREAGEGTAGGATAGTLCGRHNFNRDEAAAGNHLIPETCGALTDGAHNGGGSTGRTPTPAASSLLPDVAWCLQERDAKGADSDTKPGHLIPVIGGGFDGAIGFTQNQRDEVRAVAGALAAGPGMKQQTYIAFSAKDHGADASADVSPTLRAMQHDGSHANGGGQVAVAFNARQDHDAWNERTGPLDTDGGTFVTEEFAPTLQAQNNGSTAVPAVQTAMQVRRLTPRECERLQGFPDDYTLVPHRNKPAADGPRYKALGNSMAVPVMRWIGRKISAACTPR